jgi:hypothetical protein
MERKPHTPGRRAFLARLGGLGAALWLGPGLAVGTGPIITRHIPASGEILPVIGIGIGMGIWITFDVGSDTTELATRVAILRTFFAAGRCRTGRRRSAASMPWHCCPCSPASGCCRASTPAATPGWSATWRP